jgi:hypothetical protein
MYYLAQAAKAAGKSKPIIARAIKAGRISALRSEDGRYSIDPLELARVFPLVGDSTGTMKQLIPPDGTGTYPTISPAKSKAPCVVGGERGLLAICAPGSTAKPKSNGDRCHRALRTIDRAKGVV